MDKQTTNVMVLFGLACILLFCACNSLKRRRSTGNSENFSGVSGADYDHQKLLLHNNRCSKHCCSPQWPLPFKLTSEDKGDIDYTKYVPTNYRCQSDKEVGCVCMDDKQHDYLASRGGNGFNGFNNSKLYTTGQYVQGSACPTSVDQK
jgi:hypothetical protein